MKKYIHRAALVLMVMTILSSCKKDNAKDYSASIEGKNWWGMLAYTGKTPEYYSVHFNTDNTLTWSQLSGDYAGHWVLDAKELTITFAGTTVEIKVNISDNNQMVNIRDNTSASEINSGELIANTNTSLDNTAWNGTIDYPSTKGLQLSFKPGSQVVINIENSPIKTYTYTTASSNAIIRISSIFFGIIVSDSKMKGCVDNSTYIWQATKQ